MRTLAALLDFIFPLRPDERIVRELREDDLLSLLDPEIVPMHGIEATALLPFRNERVRAAIHEAKYHGSEKAFALLAATLTEYLGALLEESKPGLDVVLVPVPLGAKRRRERGFNQVEEVLKIVVRDPVWTLSPNLLVRLKETASQVSLSRSKRLTNMRNAFACTPGIGPDRTYIVIDDVATTGATLDAACEALRRAGAERLFAIALAS
jgi:ComF family protein